MNCLDCKFCGDIVPGSSHHRSCNALGEDFSTKLMIAATPLVVKGTDKPPVTQNEHGVKNGWCTWPLNFDPIWIDDCVFFKEKIEE